MWFTSLQFSGKQPKIEVRDNEMLPDTTGTLPS